MIYLLVVRQTVIRVVVIRVAVIGVVLNLLIFIFRRIAEIVDKHMLGNYEYIRSDPSRMVSFNMSLIVVSHTTVIQPTRAIFYSLICTPYIILHTFIGINLQC